VLDAERTMEQNQISLAENRTAEGVNLVRLHRTRDGGWESAERS